MSHRAASFPAFLLLVALGLSACVDLSPPRGGVEMRDGDPGASPDGRDGSPGDDRAPNPIPDAAEDTTASTSEDADGAPAPPDAAVTEVSAPVDTPAPAEVSAETPPLEVAPPIEVFPPVDQGPAPGLALGAACTSGSSCASGNCVDGVCCENACTDACRACNRPSTPGTCAPEPAQTSCGAASCNGGTARAPSVCDGAGACLAGATTACGAYACYDIYCGSACITNADCAAPFVCSGIACVSPGLLLRWAFDEESGNTVQDASGNGRTGTMIGSGTNRPQPSTNVAPLAFPNARSRLFVASLDEGVVASPVPASLKSTPELTLAGWFRATATEETGSEIVALGSDYMLRIENDGVAMCKRKSTQPSLIYALAKKGTTAHLDGRWHHLAGTSGAAGMKVYLDGVEVGSTGNAEAPIFNGPDQIGVGHRPGDDLHEHDGEIDEVRIYGRVLSAAEIANLALGNR